jgi:glycosyltransferase involved in cell wall biosynthesis
MRGARLLYLVTEDWYFWSHRRDLARAAQDAGLEVLVATRVTDHGKLIEDEGFKLLPIGLRRNGRQPVRELVSVAELYRLYRREQPDLVHHVAMKPILYGSIAARLAKVPAVANAFTGLGYAFIGSSGPARVLGRTLAQALRWALDIPKSRVILQNDEDRSLLVQSGVIPDSRAVIIRGAGVDTARFKPGPSVNGSPCVLLPARMLWDKGVGEFVQAARILRERGVHAAFVLVGMVDAANPAHVSEAQLLAWEREGVVRWWGYRTDMAAILSSAHVVVLPSYREGLPKVLLEAAACGRAIVAADVPGCREIVRDGENGLLVPAKDASALADAIQRLLQDPTLRARMEGRSREIAVREFSMDRIVQETLAVYRDLLGEFSRHSAFPAKHE